MQRIIRNAGSFSWLELELKRISNNHRWNKATLDLIVLYRMIVHNCRFSYAGIWELVNLSVGTKHFSYHICYENIGQKHSKILKRQTQTEHGK